MTVAIQTRGNLSLSQFLLGIADDLGYRWMNGAKLKDAPYRHLNEYGEKHILFFDPATLKVTYGEGGAMDCWNVKDLRQLSYRQISELIQPQPSLGLENGDRVTFFRDGSILFNSDRISPADAQKVVALYIKHNEISSSPRQ